MSYIKLDNFIELVMRNLIKKLFNPNQNKSLNIEVTNADKRFKEEKKKEIKNAKKEVKKYNQKINEELEELKLIFNDIEGFNDKKDRKAVEDIADNLAEDKQKEIEKFSLTENPEKNLENLKQFLIDFQNLKRKEAAVLEITFKQKEVGKVLKKLEQIGEDLENFISNEYLVIKVFNNIKANLKRIKEIEETISSLHDKNNKTKISDLEEEIKRKEEELAKFRNSEIMSDYRQLQAKLEKKKSYKNELNSKLDKNMKKMERGLKKLIYEAENSDLFLSDINSLKWIRDQNQEKILQEPKRIEKALPQVKHKGNISKIQRDKLKEGITILEDLSHIKKEIDSLEKDITQLDSEIQNHDGPKKVENLERTLNSLEKDLGSVHKDQARIEDEISKLNQEKNKLIEEIARNLQDNIDHEVVIN